MDSIKRFGFGCMRFPTNADESINYELTEKMIDYALQNGVNYFDTAYVYHAGKSETVLGDILKKYPRESFMIANKYPGHQIADTYDPEPIFMEQLERCKVDYFDYYLLHNVNENSIKVYKDEKWGILEYFKEQKRLGKIKRLGFSCHCSVELLKEFLDYCGDSMEFCQIQLNYLDWTLQDGKTKYDLLTERNIPVFIMEPLRGGKLASLPEDSKEKLNKLKEIGDLAAAKLDKEGKFIKNKEKKVEEQKEPETKVCPFCLTDVKYHATRCPHCTSELVKEVEAK